MGIEAVTMLIGVDAGGTSTRAVVVDPSGECLGYGVAGGGNPISWGADRAAAAIRDAVAAAIGEGPTGRTPAAVTLAMAGATSFFAPGVIEGHLAPLGLDATVHFGGDLLATFCAGSPALEGYALVSGTGSAAIRVSGGVVTATADGLGWLLGDDGSGFWIGHQVARAAVAALDGRGPATTLAALVVDDLGSQGDASFPGRSVDLQRVVVWLYQGKPVELSRFAALAIRAAGAGDEVASAILDRARAGLATTLGAVLAPELAGPVVIGGGIARRLPALDAALAETVSERCGRRPEIITVEDGTVGAGVLALRTAGIEVSRAVFDRLTTSVARLRDA